MNKVERLKELLPMDNGWSSDKEQEDKLEEIEDILFDGQIVHEVFEEGGRWTNYRVEVHKIMDGKEIIYVQESRELPATEIQDGGEYFLEYNEVFPYKETVTKYSFTPKENKFGNEMDLQRVFDMQEELDNFILGKHPELAPQGLSEWVKQVTIAMEDEISEIRGEINWKHWKKPKNIDLEALREEVIDLWHFLVQLSYKVGLDAQDVFDTYKKKHQENLDRQNGKSKEKDYS